MTMATIEKMINQFSIRHSINNSKLLLAWTRPQGPVRLGRVVEGIWLVMAPSH
jgi:hypothetical protein